MAGVVGQFEKWHGRLAREITRKMRVPPQTDPLLYDGSCPGLSLSLRSSAKTSARSAVK